MRANRLRLYLILVLALAAVLSVVGNKTSSVWLGQVAIAAFFAAVVLYALWRRTALRERRGRVFDPEAKTDAAGTRPDQ